MKRLVSVTLFALLISLRVVQPMQAAGPSLPCSFDELAAAFLAGGPVFHGTGSFSIGFTDATWSGYAKAAGYTGEANMTAFASWLQNTYGAKAVYEHGYSVEFTTATFKSPCPPPPPPGAPSGSPAPQPSHGDPFGLLGILAAIALLIFGGRRWIPVRI